MKYWQLRQLPYHSDSTELVARLRALGPIVFLDSGTPNAGSVPSPIDASATDIIAVAPSERCELKSDAKATEWHNCLQRLCATTPRAALDDSNEPTHALPGWYGVWSYDLGSLTEQLPLPRHASNGAPQRPWPLLWMGFFPAVVSIDHQRQLCTLCYLPAGAEIADRIDHLISAHSHSTDSETSGFRLTQPFSARWQPTDYASRFTAVQTHIHAGDCYQINLTQAFESRCEGDPLRAYTCLRQAHRAPMSAYVSVDHWHLLSISPERFIAYDGTELVTRPIKGTRPRHADPIKDAAQREALRASRKDQAENVMIVDLLRNDFGKICQPGSVTVDGLFNVESFSQVHHLVSTVRGIPTPDVHPLEALAAAFPGGSITGAPKHMAMQLIAELEAEPRHFYCGSVVYADIGGRMDSSILIRSFLISGDYIMTHAGGGIVADSQLDAEYQECFDKIQGLIQTLEQTLEKPL